MINRFYEDYTCKAVFRFETDSVNVDSQHSNHLTNLGVTNNISDYREGYASAFFNGTARMFRADTDLDTGFPLKYIENNVDRENTISIISVAFWVKFTDVIGIQTIVAKHNESDNRRCWMVYIDSGTLKVVWGYGGGTNQQIISSGTTLVADRWYHIGVSCSSEELVCQFYIYDVVAGDVIYNDLYESIFEVMTTSTADFTIGSDHSGNYKLSAILDELIVFNTFKKPNEYDQIRLGQYQGPLGNSLINDPTCMAWYDFEPDQICVDWMSGNTLTDVHTISASLNFFKTNKQAVYFNRVNQEYAYRLDTDLHTGFPLKTGDVDRALTISFWVRLDSFMSGSVISKSANVNGSKGFVVYFSGPYLQIWWGDGNAFQVYQCLGFSFHRWYHVAITADGINKDLTVRVWDDVLKQIVYFNLVHPDTTLFAGSGPFSFGHHFETNEYFSGWLDEVIIFNQTKTFLETDLMRQGKYHRRLLFAHVESVGSMPVYSLRDGTKVCAVGTQHSYLPLLAARVNAVGLMVVTHASNRFTVNNYLGDPDCAASYSFESGSLLKDSKNGNDLTDHGSIDPVQ